MLTPPLVSELEAFANTTYDDSEKPFVTVVINQATVALWAYTGLADYPADPQLTQITRWAILELTLWLIIQSENRDEIYSPFSSERIGSYSYAKMQQARYKGAQSTGGTSGLFWLDLFFENLSMLDPNNAVASVKSYYVFDPSHVRDYVSLTDIYTDYFQRYNYNSGVDAPPIADTGLDLVALFEEHL